MIQYLNAWCKKCGDIATADCLYNLWHAAQVEERDYDDQTMISLLDLERGCKLISQWNYTITGEAILSVRYEPL